MISSQSSRDNTLPRFFFLLRLLTQNSVLSGFCLCSSNENWKRKNIEKSNSDKLSKQKSTFEIPQAKQLVTYQMLRCTTRQPSQIENQTKKGGGGAGTGVDQFHLGEKKTTVALTLSFGPASWSSRGDYQELKRLQGFGSSTHVRFSRSVGIRVSSTGAMNTTVNLLDPRGRLQAI